MATNYGLQFGHQVDEWTRQTEARMLAIFRGSTQEVVSRMQARIPIDTGFARASIVASTHSMPLIDKKAYPADGASEKAYPYEAAQITVVIVGASLGETIYVGWTAAYVVYLEWGHSMQAPLGFVGITAAEWPGIVREQIALAKASVRARTR